MSIFYQRMPPKVAVSQKAFLVGTEKNYLMVVYNSVCCEFQLAAAML
jgi:hypothetical protein